MEEINSVPIANLMARAFIETIERSDWVFDFFCRMYENTDKVERMWLVKYAEGGYL